MSKTLYHSQLRDMGPVTVTVKTGPTKSKFDKPSAPKPMYCTLTINGEDFYYTLDSEQVTQFVTQHKGQTLAVVAEGGKEDSVLTAVGAPASQLERPAANPAQAGTHRDPTPAQRTQSPASHDTSRPASEQAGDTLTNAKHFVARNRVLAVIGLEAAWHTKREFEQAKQFEMPDAVFAALLNCMLFGASASGITATNQGIPLDLKFKVEAAKS